MYVNQGQNEVNYTFDSNAPQESSNMLSQNTGTSNPKRSRITRACDTCRRKKIKCDVDTRHPCTTCKQYEWECTFRDTAKKRGPPKGYIESLETRLEKMEKLLKNLGDDGHPENKAEEEEEEQASPLKRSRTSTSLASSKVVRYHGSSSGYYLVGNILSTNGEQQNDQDQPRPAGEEPNKVLVMPSYKGREIYRLRKMNVNDNDLMIIRDATADEEAIQLAVDEQESILDIIPKEVLIGLVNTYFNNYTTLPIIDKKQYMDAFNGMTTPPPAPLLTYAICTYSCFLLKSSDAIFTDNHVDRDEVFQSLLDRSSLLVRKEYLKPRIVTIQALILLCGHPTYSTSSYRNWILAGMAVRMAQDLGLHRTLTTVEVSHDFKERRKKLWYSAYCTDRWCCAVMGRPLAIADSDCDVDLPLIESNGIEDLTVFVNFVKLSGILGEVLRRIYSPKAKLHGYKTKSMEHTVTSLQTMLEEWFLNVPSGYKITEQDLLDLPALYKDNKKMNLGGPLTVTYHCVVLLLHRPFIVLDNNENMALLNNAVRLCNQAAKSAIDVARAIPYMSIAQFGWNFAAYSVFQAALIHVYNCTSKDPDVVAEARQYVKICIDECLEPLSKDIPAGPPLIPFLQTLSNLLKTDSILITDKSSSTLSQQQQQPEPPLQQPAPIINPMTGSSSTDYVPQPEDTLHRGDIGSWLFNGGINGNPALSQTAWQQLFSTAGTPFSNTDPINCSGGRFEAQGWDSFFTENQCGNNLFTP